MAEEEQADKTIEPTPHRLRKAQEKGDFAQSKEVPTVLTFFCAVLLLYGTAPHMLDLVTRVFTDMMRFETTRLATIEGFPELMRSCAAHALKIVGPFLIVAFLAGIIGNVCQIGFGVYTEKPAKGAKAPSTATRAIHRGTPTWGSARASLYPRLYAFTRFAGCRSKHATDTLYTTSAHTP